MGLNDTPSGERVHIGFFGRRNVGKSSIVNEVTGQDLAVVSETKGTTTDPVSKAMELLPLGPVVIIDTPGYDDTGTLGEKRVRKTRQVLNKTDIAVLVTDASEGLTESDLQLIRLFEEKQIAYLIVYNKSDLVGNHDVPGDHEIYVSAREHSGIYDLKERIAALKPDDERKCRLVGDLIKPSDLLVLVVPVDSAAPKGRLILPQQQAIRDILDSDAEAVVVKETQLAETLGKLSSKPALVITDSQAFAKVSEAVPDDVRLTSFSILMARYKGFLDEAVHGVTAVEKLRDGDTVLIAEGCTHHRQCDDIGTVKIPRWLRNYTGKNIQIKTVSGTEFPEDLSPYAMVIHCGACMLNDREVLYRMKCAVDQKVPFTNYGITIAYMQGILKRCTEIFPHLADCFR